MSVELYKAQAERLARHLAVKHGVKLKNSSLLESIAILHGQRDWNHLVASTMSPAQVAALEAVDTGAAGPQSVGAFLCDLLKEGYRDVVFFANGMGPAEVRVRRSGFTERVTPSRPVPELMTELLTMADLPRSPMAWGADARLALHNGADYAAAYLHTSSGAILVRLEPVRSLVDLRYYQKKPIWNLAELGFDQELATAWLDALQRPGGYLRNGQLQSVDTGMRGGVFIIAGPTAVGKSVTMDVTCRALQKRGLVVANISLVAEFPPLEGGFNLPESMLGDTDALIGFLRSYNVQVVAVADGHRYFREMFALARTGFKVIANLHTSELSKVPGALTLSGGVLPEDVSRHLRAAMRVSLLKTGEPVTEPGPEKRSRVTGAADLAFFEDGQIVSSPDLMTGAMARIAADPKLSDYR